MENSEIWGILCSKNTIEEVVSFNASKGESEEELLRMKIKRLLFLEPNPIRLLYEIEGIYDKAKIRDDFVLAKRAEELLYSL